MSSDLHQNAQKMQNLYVDRLNRSSFKMIFFHLRKRHFRGQTVFVIDERTRFHNFYTFLLKCMRINAQTLEFSLSTLTDKNAQSLYITALQETSRISLILIDILAQTAPEIKKFDDFLKKNFVHLFLLKSISEQTAAYVQYHLIFKRMHSGDSDTLIAARPPFWPNRKELKEYAGPEILFYSERLEHFFFLSIKKWLRLLQVYVISTFKSMLVKTKLKTTKNTNSILMFCESESGTDSTYRIQPFWADIRKKSQDSVLILETSVSRKLFPLANKAAAPPHLEYLTVERFFGSSKYLSKHSVNGTLANFRNLLSIHISNTPFLFLRVEYFKLRLLALLAEKFATACKNEKVKLIFLTELHSTFADLAMLSGIAAELPVVSCQYSSLWRISPTMLSIADTHFIFSDSYRDVYVTAQINPKNFQVIGYPLQKPTNSLLDRSLKQKASLASKGLHFIVGYLDENYFEDHKWSLINASDYARDLGKLSTFALNNRDIAIVMKPQFNLDDFSHQIFNQSSIKKAVARGKLIHLKYGKGTRNRVLPTEAGLISDICICLKIGMTAAIEVALLGKRVILIDNFNVRGRWDYLFEGQKIVYPDLESALQDIKKFKESPMGDNIGDWKNIISSFVSTNEKYGAISAEKFIKKFE